MADYTSKIIEVIVENAANLLYKKTLKKHKNSQFLIKKAGNERHVARFRLF